MSISTFSVACFSTDKCDSACWSEIALYHTITLEKFNAMIGENTAFKTFSVNGGNMADLTGPVNEAICGSEVITIDTATGLVSHAPALIALYSVPLMLGVLAKNPDSVSFYRATDMKTGDDLVIFSIDCGGVLTCYDLTDSQP